MTWSIHAVEAARPLGSRTDGRPRSPRSSSAPPPAPCAPWPKHGGRPGRLPARPHPDSPASAPACPCRPAPCPTGRDDRGCAAPPTAPPCACAITTTPSTPPAAPPNATPVPSTMRWNRRASRSSAVVTWQALRQTCRLPAGRDLRGGRAAAHDEARAAACLRRPLSPGARAHVRLAPHRLRPKPC